MGRSQQLEDVGLDFFRFCGGTVALHDVALAVDEKLREVPLDGAGAEQAGFFSF